MWLIPAIVSFLEIKGSLQGTCSFCNDISFEYFEYIMTFIVIYTPTRSLRGQGFDSRWDGVFTEFYVLRKEQ